MRITTRNLARIHWSVSRYSNQMSPEFSTLFAHCSAYSVTLKTVSVPSCETSVNLYHTARRH
jgi:hypothetical protein